MCPCPTAVSLPRHERGGGGAGGESARITNSAVLLRPGWRWSKGKKERETEGEREGGRKNDRGREREGGRRENDRGREGRREERE